MAENKYVFECDPVAKQMSGVEPVDNKCLFCIHRWECDYSSSGVCRRDLE